MSWLDKYVTHGLESPENTCAPAGETGAGTAVVGKHDDTAPYLTAGTPTTWAGDPETLPAHQWPAIAAERYARHGFKVGPLNGKVPLTPHGFKDFTTNLEQVRAWWQQQPGANIGANPPRGVVVLDVDPRNGGWETWQRLNHGHHLPETLTTITGSCGWHFWFRLPYAGEVRGSAGEGVDVKTHTGYLVMPPSIHPDTGGHYLLAWWAAPAVLPTWLRPHVYRPLPKPVQARRATTAGDTPGTGLVQTVAEAKPGERNSTLFWAACRAVAEGLALEDELTTAAQEIGLTAGEIATTLASARRTEQGAA